MCEFCNSLSKLYKLYRFKHVYLSIHEKYPHPLKLFINYMVSERCKSAVKVELKKMGLHFMVVDLVKICSSHLFLSFSRIPAPAEK